MMDIVILLLFGALALRVMSIERRVRELERAARGMEATDGYK